MSVLLSEGDVFELVPGDRVYTTVPRHMAPTNVQFCGVSSTAGDWKLHQAEITVGQDLSQGCNAQYLVGKYIVLKTENTGGGTGMGKCDVFPSGHKVTAQHAEHASVIVSFYQTGCFTCMLPNKRAIGRAKATWSIEVNETSRPTPQDTKEG